MSLWPARLEQLTSGGRDVRVVRSALAGPHRWLHVVLSALMIFSTVVVVLAVFLMRTDTIRVSRVLTGSMKPLLPVGTVVVTRPIPSSQVKVGDVIMFMPPKEWAGPDAKPVIHRVAEITHTEDGATGIKTKGDNNTAVDPWTLNANGIQAYKLAWHSYLLGRLFDFAKGLWLPVLIASAGFWGLYRIVRWLWFPSGRRVPEEDEAEDDQPPRVGPAPPRPPVRSWPAMTITALFSSNGDRPYVESAPLLCVSDADPASAAETVPLEAVEPIRSPDRPPRSPG